MEGIRGDVAGSKGMRKQSSAHRLEAKLEKVVTKVG
jgi:hypothetical protein